MASLPGVARYQIALNLCEQLEWKTLTGQPKLDACHRLLEKLERQGRLINGYYPIVIDGTQKLARDWCFSDEALHRKVGSQESGKEQSYIYVLEAWLSFPMVW